jgi:amino acid transporter
MPAAHPFIDAFASIFDLLRVQPLIEISALITLLNYGRSVQLLIEIAALITLRVKQPELHRPFAIPLSTPWLAMLMVPPSAFCLYVCLTR